MSGDKLQSELRSINLNHRSYKIWNLNFLYARVLSANFSISPFHQIESKSLKLPHSSYVKSVQILFYASSKVLNGTSKLPRFQWIINLVQRLPLNQSIFCWFKLPLQTKVTFFICCTFHFVYTFDLLYISTWCSLCSLQLISANIIYFEVEEEKSERFLQKFPKEPFVEILRLIGKILSSQQFSDLPECLLVSASFASLSVRLLECQFECPSECLLERFLFDENL